MDDGEREEAVYVYDGQEFAFPITPDESKLISSDPSYPSKLLIDMLKDVDFVKQLSLPANSNVQISFREVRERTIPIQQEIDDGGIEYVCAVTSDFEQPPGVETEEAAHIEDNPDNSKLWTDATVKLLISEYGEKHKLVKANKIPSLEKLWLAISTVFQKMGHPHTPKQLKYKWRNLDNRYRTIVDNNGQTGRGRAEFAYFKAMNDILQKEKNISPDFTMGSMSSKSSKVKESAVAKRVDRADENSSDEFEVEVQDAQHQRLNQQSRKNRQVDDSGLRNGESSQQKRKEGQRQIIVAIENQDPTAYLGDSDNPLDSAQDETPRRKKAKPSSRKVKPAVKSRNSPKSAGGEVAQLRLEMNARFEKLDEDRQKRHSERMEQHKEKNRLLREKNDLLRIIAESYKPKE